MTAVRASNRFTTSRATAVKEIETTERTRKSSVPNNFRSAAGPCPVRVAHAAPASQTRRAQCHSRACAGGVRTSQWRTPATAAAMTKGRHGFVTERPGIWNPPNTAAWRAATPSSRVRMSAARTHRGGGPGSADGGTWSLRK